MSNPNHPSFPNPAADRFRGRRYIRLVRCSTKGQADTSLDDQLALLDAFAKQRGMVHVDDLVLEGLSVSMPRRFVEDLIARKKSKDDFDVLLVQDTSRLTRGGAQHGAKLEYDLRAAGIDVVFALDGGVPQDEFGEVVRGMQYLGGRQAAKAISTASTRGAQSALEQGRTAYCRRPPYGVDRLYTAPDGTPKYVIRNLADGSQVKLDPATGTVIDRFAPIDRAYSHNRKQKDERVVLIPGDPDQVAAVRRIFARRFIDNWGQHRIAKELNDLGVVGPGGKDWSMQAVVRIYKNPVYTGRSVANLWTTGIYNMRSPAAPKPSDLDPRRLQGRARPPMRVRPREEWVEREEPRLLDYLEPRVRALAVAQQDLWLAARAGGYEPVGDKDRHRESPYVLKGLLTSRQGGYPLTGQVRGRKGGEKRYYAVSRAFRRPREADKVLRKAVLAEPIEKLVLNAVRMTLLAAPTLRESLRREVEAMQKAARSEGSGGEGLTKLKEKLADLKRRTAFVIKNVALLGEDAAGAELADLARQRDEVQRLIAVEEATGSAPTEDAGAVAERLVESLRTMGLHWDLRCQPALRSLLRVLVAKAEVDLETGHLDLELRLPRAVLGRLGTKDLTSELMGLDPQSSRRPGDEAHPEGGPRVAEGLPLLRLRALRLPRWYVACGVAA